MDLDTFSERYREMSTDELLDIYVSSDLVESALKALQAELERRGATSNDIIQTINHNDYLSKTIDRPTRRSTKIIVNVLGVLFVGAVILIIRMIMQGIF